MLVSKKLLDVDGLRAACITRTAVCQCSLGSCLGWESITEDRWPVVQMCLLGTLRDEQQLEPTYEEQHVSGTRYDSKNAPVAVSYFPYNRCDVFACQQCERRLLRYTEFGGYYVDHRVRELQKDLIAG